MDVQVAPDRMEAFAVKTIGGGAHKTPNGVGCAMELASFLAGEPWSDRPACVSPVIAGFMRTWNDGLPSDAERDRVLRDIIPQTLGSATGAADDETRAYMALDWLVRVHTPAWLRLAGLGDHADILAGELAAIVDMDTATAAGPKVRAAGDAAWDAAGAAARAAAGDAAWAAAGAAARDAAWATTWAAARAAALDAAGAAAWAAAGAAARDAARDAARGAARGAARDAARAAARGELAPTVAELQSSARDLVIRMCEVGR